MKNVSLLLLAMCVCGNAFFATKCDALARSLSCPIESLDSQFTQYGTFALGNSSNNTSQRQVFERVSIGAETVVKIRWWGATTNAVLTPCDPTQETYQVGFYVVSGVIPNAPISVQTVTPTITNTGRTLFGAPLWLFEANLPTPVSLPGGEAWLSIYVPNTVNSCLFAWAAGDGGDGAAKQFNSSTLNYEDVTNDMSFCLIANGTETYVDTVTLSPDRDNSIYSEGVLSNGAGENLFSAMTNSGNLRRALIHFDISAAAIPANATILLGELQLTANDPQAVPPTVDIDILRLTSDWGEGTSDAPLQEGAGAAATTGDATWIDSFFSGVTPTLWTSPGGDYDPKILDTTSVVDNQVYSWASPRTAQCVQDWYEGLQPNYGWILVSPETTAGDAKRFASRENPTAGDRPKLIIKYTLDPLPTHSADKDSNMSISLSELLRMVQLFNISDYHCDGAGEDGFNPGVGIHTCLPHSSDFSPQDWKISLTELLRIIQIFNLLGYYNCPLDGTGDAFCPGLP